jgi:O-methyltransferase
MEIRETSLYPARTAQDRLKEYIAERRLWWSSRKWIGSKWPLRILRQYGWKALWMFLKASRYTMASTERLVNAYDLCVRSQNENVPGAFVECGVWRGGCSGAMAYAGRKNSRLIHLFDSFEGLPEPVSAVDGALSVQYSDNRARGELKAIGQCVAPIEDVRTLLSVLRIDFSKVVFHKGWFQDTLPTDAQSIGSIAVLRLDGDWYESTKVCLNYLYDKVSPGGYVIIDDYGHWEGCKRAIDEFFQVRRIKAELVYVDYAGRYFQKPR